MNVFLVRHSEMHEPMHQVDATSTDTHTHTHTHTRMYTQINACREAGMAALREQFKQQKCLRAEADRQGGQNTEGVHSAGGGWGVGLPDTDTEHGLVKASIRVEHLQGAVRNVCASLKDYAVTHPPTGFMHSDGGGCRESSA
jgi:hypothetical protein